MGSGWCSKIRGPASVAAGPSRSGTLTVASRGTGCCPLSRIGAQYVAHDRQLKGHTASNFCSKVPVNPASSVAVTEKGLKVASGNTPVISPAFIAADSVNDEYR
jgi:hypothetical protein